MWFCFASYSSSGARLCVVSAELSKQDIEKEHLLKDSWVPRFTECQEQGLRSRASWGRGLCDESGVYSSTETKSDSKAPPDIRSGFTGKRLKGMSIVPGMASDPAGASRRFTWVLETVCVYVAPGGCHPSR